MLQNKHVCYNTCSLFRMIHTLQYYTDIQAVVKYYKPHNTPIQCVDIRKSNSLCRIRCVSRFKSRYRHDGIFTITTKYIQHSI